MKVKKSLKVRWIITAVALVLLAAAGITAKLSVGFANWYGDVIYPFLVGIFARISGIFPFSLAEIVVTLAVLTCLFAIIYFIVQLVRKKGQRLRFLLSSVSTAVDGAFACRHRFYVQLRDKLLPHAFFGVFRY